MAEVIRGLDPDRPVGLPTGGSLVLGAGVQPGSGQELQRVTAHAGRSDYEPVRPHQWRGQRLVTLRRTDQVAHPFQDVPVEPLLGPAPDPEPGRPDGRAGQTLTTGARQ